MKTAFICVCASMLMTAPAFADRCGSRPEPVDMVNGLRAERAEMQQANTRLIGYTKAVNRYLNCLSTEGRETRAEAKSLKNTYDRQVTAFNRHATKN
jgi:hypothetical protein